MIVCSFSGPAAELRGMDRTPDNLIAALRRNPRVSCFDMSEKKWLRDCIGMLVAKGTLIDHRDEPYPWCRYTVATQPEREGRGNG